MSLSETVLVASHESACDPPGHGTATSRFRHLMHRACLFDQGAGLHRSDLRFTRRLGGAVSTALDSIQSKGSHTRGSRPRCYRPRSSLALEAGGPAFELDCSGWPPRGVPDAESRLAACAQPMLHGSGRSRRTGGSGAASSLSALCRRMSLVVLCNLSYFGCTTCVCFSTFGVATVRTRSGRESERAWIPAQLGRVWFLSSGRGKEGVSQGVCQGVRGVSGNPRRSDELPGESSSETMRRCVAVLGLCRTKSEEQTCKLTVFQEFKFRSQIAVEGATRHF